MILKKLLKKPVRRYMFWQELGLIHVFQKETYKLTFFSRLSLATVHLYGCALIVR